MCRSAAGPIGIASLLVAKAKGATTVVVTGKPSYTHLTDIVW